MPTMYGPRKSSRGQWSEEQLKAAVEAVRNQNWSIRQAAKDHNIPEKTLRTRLKTGNLKKGSLGGASFLGEEAEKKLVAHIRNLQSAGFAPSRKTLRQLAYNLAKSMGLQGRFNNTKKIAGNDWLKLFMRRNPTLSIRQSEGVSLARAEGMNKEEVQQYFQLLTKTLTDHDLLNKPLSIFNMDETGLQLNNEPGKVVAIKGSKVVQSIKSTERGETITLVACCNAEGNFLPPYCIFKGVNKQLAWEEAMPPGSVIKMRRESAYINEELFMDCLTNHFIPRKPPGKCILILDGHGSHMNSYEMLETAVENDVILLCLPSHTTHYLQPLDRSFFKSLKAFFKNQCDEFVRANPQTKIHRRHFGMLLSSAWANAATSKNGTSGFAATGIFPLKPSVIPEYAFLVADPTHRVPSEDNERLNEAQVCAEEPIVTNLAVPGTSSSSDWTPTKILCEISPVPTISVPTKRPRRKQSAQNLTELSYMEERKEKRLKKEESGKKKKEKQQKMSQSSKTVKTVKKRIFCQESSSDEADDFIVNDTTDDEDLDENECVECLDRYETTSSNSDWIRCNRCMRWLHETCSNYDNTCMRCGRMQQKKQK
ncbi:hypothetical protein Zmor_003240 [Zophobas morio]|uniref:HTH CENPB-type domain-containing protein n=1 Tax=Zophobas morio TaxID=2755281 RepID=A0AA38HNF2_9CUCU|nr:hypothetical protein Zmor_003240 [Zophobas morio]